MMKILAPLVLLCAAAPVFGLLPDEENTIKVFKDASPSVVFVTNIAVERNAFLDAYAVPHGAGSGFIWDKEGHIVTNFHVVNGGDAFLVTLKDHTELEAKVIGVEPRKDIAVLQVTKSLSKMVPIAVGNSENLLVGQKAIAIGNPFGLDNTLTKGVVSALGRSIEGIGQVTIHDVIQTDAAINPGNSGGPLLDSDGKLIGMNTMIYSPSGSSAGVGFAVPVSFIKRIVPQLIKYGKTIQPGIGVSILTPGQTEQLLGSVEGVVVSMVSPNTPAARAGLEGIRRDRRTGRLLLGDIIIGVDDAPIKNYDDLYNALDRRKVGDTVTVRTYRGGKKSSYRLELINVF
jgi:S1-C subfamily serine protease